MAASAQTDSRASREGSPLEFSWTFGLKRTSSARIHRDQHCPLSETMCPAGKHMDRLHHWSSFPQSAVGRGDAGWVADCADGRTQESGPSHKIFPYSTSPQGA